ncbi:MAG: helix-turn-helix transcriptional regulator [Phenylobacterium sp.]|nr:helix-turn-helix transcriptional regulator [Phenylobacterium sp.]
MTTRLQSLNGDRVLEITATKSVNQRLSEQTVLRRKAYLEASIARFQLQLDEADADAYSQVVEFLVALRKRQGITQVELARRLGRPQQFVSFVETKERGLNVVEFAVYVRALGGDPVEAITQVYAKLSEDVRI